MNMLIRPAIVCSPMKASPKVATANRSQRRKTFSAESLLMRVRLDGSAASIVSVVRLSVARTMPSGVAMPTTMVTA
jgi:hypothetical protein